MDLDVVVKHLETFFKWLDEYLLNGFNLVLITVREVLLQFLN